MNLWLNANANATTANAKVLLLSISINDKPTDQQQSVKMSRIQIIHKFIIDYNSSHGEPCVALESKRIRLIIMSKLVFLNERP